MTTPGGWSDVAELVEPLALKGERRDRLDLYRAEPVRRRRRKKIRRSAELYPGIFVIGRREFMKLLVTVCR